MHPLRRFLPVVLWSAVLVALAFLLRQQARQRAGTIHEGDDLPAAFVRGGAELFEVPWKHLSDMPDFDLVDQRGERVTADSLRGEVCVFYFFFSTCPTICRDLNRHIERLNGMVRDLPVRFVGVSVDPETDTPPVLARYAADFGAEPPRWSMLTGPLHRIREFGEYGLRVTIAKEVHTDNIIVFDRWGRYRDRFLWDDPDDITRFVQVAKQLAEEKEVPLESMVRTRNGLAAARPENWNSVPWLREFELVDQHGKKWYSRDRTGEVWVASFFFTRCPGICVEQNRYLAGLVERTAGHPFPLVSITTDPDHDSPDVLDGYARSIGADPGRWTFLTGEKRLVRRTAAEYFHAAVDGEHHSSLLYVVDRWHRVRGSFDWRDPAAEAAMLELIQRLQAEREPGPIPRDSPASGDTGGAGEDE